MFENVPPEGGICDLNLQLQGSKERRREMYERDKKRKIVGEGYKNHNLLLNSKGIFC